MFHVLQMCHVLSTEPAKSEGFHHPCFPTANTHATVPSTSQTPNTLPYRIVWGTQRRCTAIVIRKAICALLPTNTWDSITVKGSHHQRGSRQVWWHTIIVAPAAIIEFWKPEPPGHCGNRCHLKEISISLPPPRPLPLSTKKRTPHLQSLTLILLPRLLSSQPHPHNPRYRLNLISTPPCWVWPCPHHHPSFLIYPRWDLLLTPPFTHPRAQYWVLSNLPLVTPTLHILSTLPPTSSVICTSQATSSSHSPSTACIAPFLDQHPHSPPLLAPIPSSASIALHPHSRPSNIPTPSDSACDQLNICCLNTRGTKSSLHFVHWLLSNLSLDLLAISDHWLHDIDHHMFSSLHKDFKFIVASPPCQEHPIICAPRNIRGHGGVALGWNHRIDHLVSPIPFISSHQTIGIKLHSSLGLIYVISVYLPSQTSSSDICREALDYLDAALHHLPPSDNLIIMGDFNADPGHLGGPLSTTSTYTQGRILLQFMDKFSLVSTHQHKSNLFLSHTYESDAHPLSI